MGPMSSIWTVRRSATDAKLTGLCSGVAQHWGVDPVLVRVGCVLLALSGGIGLVLYLAGWLLIPVEGKDAAPVDDFFGASGRRWPKEVWIALIVVACLVVFAVSSSVSPFGVGPAVILAVIWYFGFYKKRTASAPSGSSASAPPPVAPPAPPEFVRYPGPPTPFTQAAEAWQQRIQENARQAAQGPGQPGAYEWPAPPYADYATSTPSRIADPEPVLTERSAFLATPDPVGLYTEPEPVVPPVLVKRRDTRSAKRLRLVCVLVLGLALTALGILDSQGITIPLAAYFGAALLVVGLTLVAATWWGRARGLLPVGLLLLVGVLITSSPGPMRQIDALEPTTRIYTQVSQFPPAGDTLEVGRLKIDLSQLDVTTDVPYRAHLDAGSMEVIVPSDVNVVVQYSVDLGQVVAYGSQHGQGTDLKDQIPDPDPALAGKPTLTLDLSIDAGELQVHR